MLGSTVSCLQLLRDAGISRPRPVPRPLRLPPRPLAARLPRPPLRTPLRHRGLLAWYKNIYWTENIFFIKKYFLRTADVYRAAVRGAGVLHARHQGAAALPPGVPPRRRGAQHRVRQQAGQEHQTQVHSAKINK